MNEARGRWIRRDVQGWQADTTFLEWVPDRSEALSDPLLSVLWSWPGDDVFDIGSADMR